MTIGYPFPIPSPYTEAQRNWIAHRSWDRASGQAARRGLVHHRALSEMERLSHLPMERCEELTLDGWRQWRVECEAQRDERMAREIEEGRQHEIRRLSDEITERQAKLATLMDR
jgi:hypothetical protein